MKVVIDANIYASSLIKPEGSIGKLLVSLLKNQNQYTIITSAAIFAEVKRILWYPKVRSRIIFTDKEIKNWLSSMQLLTERVNTEHLSLPVIVDDDPDDDKYILAAMVSGAKYIITGDTHLLKLNPYSNIEIVTPRAFQDLSFEK